MNVIFVSKHALYIFNFEETKVENSTFVPKPFSTNQLIARGDAKLMPFDLSGKNFMPINQ